MTVVRIRRQRSATITPAWMSITTVTMLAPAAATPFVPVSERAHLLGLWLAGSIAVAVLAAAVCLVRRRSRDAGLEEDPGRPKPAPLREHLATAAYVAVNLSPVVLLSLAFPFASAGLAHTFVDGVPLAALVAASSLTVPWLSQMVCSPLYRVVLGSDGSHDFTSCARRFAGSWWVVLVQTMPAVVLVAIPVQAVMRWPLAAFATFVGLSVLNLAFAMSLVLANIAKRRMRWLSGWAAYAATIALLPGYWYLPPLVAVASQILPLGRLLLTRPVFEPYTTVLTDVVRGGLTGSVLWADKYVLLLAIGERLDISLTFIAALPGVLAYNYYFVRLGPGFDERVEVLRLAMSTRPHSLTSVYAASVTAVMRRGLHLVGCIGAVAGFVVVFVVAELAPAGASYAAVVTLTAWFTTMTTLFCYKLEYLNERNIALRISAGHLVACFAIIIALREAMPAYAVLVAVEVVLFVFALRAFTARWRTPEYALFWRHATSW